MESEGYLYFSVWYLRSWRWDILRLEWEPITGVCQTQRGREELSGSRVVFTQQLQLLVGVSTLRSRPMAAYLDVLGREREDLGSDCTPGTHKPLQPLSP